MGKFISKLFGKKQVRILMLGLNAAGKTTILYKLKLDQRIATVPTIGFNVETITYKDVKFNVWDVGGQDRIKPLWRHYYADTQALVFVVDCGDRERIDEAREELHKVIKDTQMRECIILVFANKQDIRDAMDTHEIQEKLGLTKLRDRNWHVQPACGTTGEGLHDGLTWLMANIGLSGFKETVAPAELDRTLDTRPIATPTDTYPFATVLRLRVLQIVCGITFLIMGTVGFIEEKGQLNLGLGIPAGVATILAAAGSLHTTKGFGGYKPSTCLPGSSLRFLGPSVRIAVPLTILWGTACSFLTALVIQTARTLTELPEVDGVEESGDNTKKDLTILASVELGLSFITLSAVIFLLRIDCKYDPD